MAQEDWFRLLEVEQQFLEGAEQTRVVAAYYLDDTLFRLQIGPCRRQNGSFFGQNIIQMQLYRKIRNT